MINRKCNMHGLPLEEIMILMCGIVNENPIIMENQNYVESAYIIYSFVKDNGEEYWNAKLGEEFNGSIIDGIHYDDGKHEEGTSPPLLTIQDVRNTVLSNVVGLPFDLTYTTKEIPVLDIAKLKVKLGDNISAGNLYGLNVYMFNKYLRHWYLHYGGEECLNGKETE